MRECGAVRTVHQTNTNMSSLLQPGLRFTQQLFLAALLVVVTLTAQSRHVTRKHWELTSESRRAILGNLSRHNPHNPQATRENAYVSTHLVVPEC